MFRARSSSCKDVQSRHDLGDPEFPQAKETTHNYRMLTISTKDDIKKHFELLFSLLKMSYGVDVIQG
jgi:hypothetical protein